MAFKHGKDADILVGKYDLSPYVNEVSTSMAIDTAETSTLGTNAKTYITGQNDATISTSGLFDGDANAIDAIFTDIIDNDLTPTITVFQDGGFTVGSRCQLATAKQTTYDIGIPVGDVVTLNGEFQVTNGIRSGVVLFGQATQSTTSNGTSVDNTASTALGATANLHVTANARTATTVVKVQHSADNSTWADLITFATVAISTKTSETVSVSGTVNRYLRAQTTIASGTGNITLSVAVARRNN